MYSDIEKSFYIRVHEETYPASGFQIKKEIFYEIKPVSAMQKGIKLTSNLISEADIMRAFSNVVLHQGLYELLQFHSRPGTHNLVNITSEGKLLVVEELTRNRIVYLSLMTILQDHFTFGRIIFPTGFKTPYSPVGRSLNDICFRSKYNYCEKTNEVRLGYISTRFDPLSDIEIDMDDVEFQDLQSMRDDYCLAAGVLECKDSSYAIYQTIAEMIRYAGDLLADTLLKGCFVNTISVFGLALNYDTLSAKLVHLQVDFENGTSKALVSDSTVPLYPAFCWLLNAIVL